MNWQDIAKKLVIQNKLSTAITVLRLNSVDVSAYQKSFDRLKGLSGAAKLDWEDTLAAKMLADITDQRLVLTKLPQ